MADALYFTLKRILTPLADIYFSLQATGQETLPDGPFIVAGNHSSLLDWVFVARFVARPIRFVLTREFYDQTGFTGIYRWLGVIPIRDGAIELSAVRQLLATLARGEIVGVFPEGRITLDGTLLPAQPGVVAIAARAGVPIVPVGVRGAFEAFPREARLPRPHAVRVAYGLPLVIPRDVARSRQGQGRYAEELMRRIGALCGAPGSAMSTSAHER
jgi:1-acyl-sn-glycerol-3-phosphate acyltransferase